MQSNGWREPRTSRHCRRREHDPHSAVATRPGGGGTDDLAPFRRQSGPVEIEEDVVSTRRRADTVRNTLLAEGVTSDRIDERWVGEREPPVPTENGVREPRNRVVEVGIR